MSIAKNLLANTLVKFWGLAVSLLSVPIHIHLLGAEAYGIVALFFAFSFLFLFLDLGISHVLSREMARSLVATDKNTRQFHRDLVQTVKLLVLGTSFAIALAGWFFAPWVANLVLSFERLTPTEVVTAIRLLSVACAILWFTTQYRNILIGLQRQVTLGINDAVVVTARHLGVIASMMIFGATLHVFFIHVIIILLAEQVYLGTVTRRILNDHLAGTGRPDLQALKRVWRFAMGTAGTSIFGSSISIMDTLILPTILPLHQYGLYMVVRQLGRASGRLVNPITTAFRPRLAELVTNNNLQELRKFYHLGSQLTALILVPLAVTIATFANDVLFIWTRNAELASEYGGVLALMLAGTTLHGLTIMAYSLQLAYGWTRLSFTTNAILAVLLIPTLIVATQAYQSFGAASVWLVLNIVYFTIYINIMHRYLLPSDIKRWYRNVLSCVALSAGIAFFASTLPIGEFRVLVIALTFALSVGGSIFVLDEIRPIATRTLAWLRK